MVEKVTGDYEQTKVETEDGKATFTNEHIPALINEEDDDPDNDGKITVVKVWEDGDDLLGNRPTVIMVKLLANGEELQTVPVAKIQKVSGRILSLAFIRTQMVKKLNIR